MKPKSKRAVKRSHFCLLTNKSAASYDPSLIEKCTQAIKRRGHNYTVVEPNSGIELARLAEIAAGIRKSHKFYTPAVSRRGKVTALIACGGDGTVNLVARAAEKAKLPVGILPMGADNNIARSLFGESFREKAVARILSTKTRQVDVGEIGNQLFLAAVAFGLPVIMHSELKEAKRPRFGVGWSRLAGAAMEKYPKSDMVIKIDSFRFEVAPSMLIIASLSHVIGLPLNNVANENDGMAEVIFDLDQSAQDLGSYFKDANKGKYIYGGKVRLFRGKSVILQPVKGKKIYLDGEIIDLPVNVIELTIGQKKVEFLG